MSKNRSYTWTGAAGPFTVAVAAGVFMPSSTTRILGDAMRIAAGDTVLDAGCGCGVLGLAAAGSVPVLSSGVTCRRPRSNAPPATPGASA